MKNLKKLLFTLLFFMPSIAQADNVKLYVKSISNDSSIILYKNSEVKNEGLYFNELENIAFSIDVGTQEGDYLIVDKTFTITYSLLGKNTSSIYPYNVSFNPKDYKKIKNPDVYHHPNDKSFYVGSMSPFLNHIEFNVGDNQIIEDRGSTFEVVKVAISSTKAAGYVDGYYKHNITYTVRLKGNYKIKRVHGSILNLYIPQKSFGIFQIKDEAGNYPQFAQANVFLNSHTNKLIITDSESIAIQKDNSNKLDEISKGNKELNDSITSDTVDNSKANKTIQNLIDKMPQNGTITKLALLPVTFTQAIYNGATGPCQAYSFGKLLGSNLSLPCVNLGKYLGDKLWLLIDLILTTMAVMTMSKSMVKAFHGFTTLREGDVING